MDDQDAEDTFLINAALGTDLVTSYVAATDDEPKPPRKQSAAGCLFAIIAALLAVLAIRAFR